MTTLPLEERMALINQIARHLHTLDDRTLQSLAEAIRETASPAEAWGEQLDQTVSRRRFLMALLGGGALAATAGALTAWQWGADRSQTLTNRISQLEGDVERLEGLLELYRKLERVPLDGAALNGLDQVGALLGVVAKAAQRLREGSRAAQAALGQVEALLPKARVSLTWLDDSLKQLADRLHLLEDAIGRALDQVAPISEALGAFFDSLLNLLPGSAGQKAREAMERIGDVIGGLPRFSEEVRLNIVIALRQEWFSNEPGEGLNGRLIEPLNVRLLEPAMTLLTGLTRLDAGWEQELVQPVRAAIEQRAAIRREIEARGRAG